MSYMYKGSRLLTLLATQPREFYDRVLNFAEVRWERIFLKRPAYRPRQWEEVMQALGDGLDAEMDHLSREAPLAEIEAKLTLDIDKISSHAPYTLSYNANFMLARLCYIVCRALNPVTVLETGVAYGVTTAFILQALEVNGCGILHSVDLPPLARDADRFAGILVPKALRHRWRLHRGVSKRVLPKLLPQLGNVDIFVRDSLHTSRNMCWEFQSVTPYLGPRSVMIADDVDENSAFHDWVTRKQPVFCATVEKPDIRCLFGVSLFLDAHSSRA